MSSDRSFWRNVAIIAVVHLAALGGLARWSSQAIRTAPGEIVWIDAGAANLAAAVNAAPAAAKPIEAVVPREQEQPDAARPDDSAAPVPVVHSDIQLPTPTAKPTSTPTPLPSATPKPTTMPKATPSPTPKAKPTPRATPKPSPSASPKKTLLAKADSTPVKKPNDKSRQEQKQESPAPGTQEQTGPASGESAKISVKSAAIGGGGRSGSAATQLASYRKMLHDRFYNEWVQPTSAVPAGTKMSVLVKLRIEKDGRVTGFNIVQPSGNVLVDDSIAAVGRRVTQVDPLPAEFGSSHYEVNMNFELTLAQ